MRSLVRALLLISSLSLAPLPISACVHPPPTIQTPAGRTAFQADQIVLRVNELQNAAIQAEAVKELPTATTRTIVQFCVAANKTLATTPAGWQTTIVTAWTQAKAQIGPTTNPAVQVAMRAVDVVLAIEGGQ